MQEPKVTASTVLKGGRYLEYRQLDWVDAKGVARKWEAANRPAGTGAVLIVPRLLPSNRILLIRQFRPPIGAYAVEFPAGLVEPGEEPGGAAARELREETGYHAKNLVVLPAAYTSPGMSNEAVHMVDAEIDETAPENRVLRTEFDPSEMIESLLVPFGELAEFYRAESAKGTVFDAKLAAYAMALAAIR